MPPRLLTLLAVVVALAVGGCGFATEPAIEVGDRTISHDELADQLELFASHPDFSQVFFNGVDSVPSDGSYSREYVNQIITFIIGELIFERAFDDLGLSVDPDVRQAYQAQFTTPDPNLGTSLFDLIGASGSGDDEENQALRDRLVDFFAEQETFQGSFGDQQEFSEYISGVTDEIDVSSRYGSFDPDLGTVVPPDGPVPSLEGVGAPG